MNSSSSAAMTTTITATVASPLNTPRRAIARAKAAVSAPSASAAPTPNAAPLMPAAKPEPNPHTTAIAAAHAVQVSLPKAANASVASVVAMSGQNIPSPENARNSAEGPLAPDHGTMASATSATAAITAVARSRVVG